LTKNKTGHDDEGWRKRETPLKGLSHEIPVDFKSLDKNYGGIFKENGKPQFNLCKSRNAYSISSPPVHGHK
jgi:hypothetical protein